MLNEHLFLLFRSLKVTDAQICEVLGIKKVDDVDLDKLVILTGMRAAIKNGEATVQSLFEQPATSTISLEDLQLLYEMKVGALTPAEAEQAKRIIDTQEVKSYKKLHNILKDK